MPVDIQIIDSPEVEKTPVSLKAKPKEKPQKVVVEKVELSERIVQFDKKKRESSNNPYSYNFVAQKIKQSQTANQAITNPLYNFVGKYLGVDTRHDWDLFYDKIVSIADWAKHKSGENDVSKVISWLGRKSKSSHSISGNAINDLYLFSKLEKK